MQKLKLELQKLMEMKKEVDLLKQQQVRLLFNESIPQDLGFVDRSMPENEFKLEIDFLVGKKMLGKIIDKCYLKHGPTKTSIMLD